MNKSLPALAVTLLLLPLASAVQGYTPQSPKVQQLVGRAVRFLEVYHVELSRGSYEKLGGCCLTGLAVFKHTGNENHPLVRAGVDKCRTVIADGRRLYERDTIGDFQDSNYDVGIALLFLCEVDPQLYRSEIQTLLKVLLQRQQRGGAWSYAPASKGDTSQTQYGVLGLWMAHRADVNVPQQAVEAACNWLLRTQTPAGAFGYDPTDPGSYNRQDQPKTSISLTAAGLGSAYICADLLGFVEGNVERRRPRRIPAALREVGGSEERGPVTNRVAGSQLNRVLRDGNSWFDQQFRIPFDYYQHYYLYALERYMTFREYAERRRRAEPRWYNLGVDFLAETQRENGSWGDSYAGPVIDTAFAVLFLLRSTQAALGGVAESGRLQGGKSLPNDLSQIAVDDRGQVVSTKEKPPIDELLSQLEEAAASRVDPSIPQYLPLSTDPETRRAQRLRLRRMATGGAYQARLTAVRTLGRDRTIENVPALIYALSDPDPRVARAAEEGLRFISRRAEGLSFDRQDDETRARQRAWEDWYLTVEPSGELIER